MTKHSSTDPGTDPRAISALLLKAVIQDKRSLQTLLAERLNPSGKNNALIHELTAGSLRWWWQLDLIVGQLLNKPLKSKDFDLHCLIVLGLYQLRNTRIPDHASVSQTVNVTALWGKSWAKKLVNAVLRKYLRESQTIESKLADSEGFKYSHPSWMVDQIRRDWPQDWRSILSANNQQSRLTLRVNQQSTTAAEVSTELEQAGYAVSQVTNSPDGLIVSDGTGLWNTDLWRSGKISVQDESAQLAAYMVDLHPGMRVLDACAAPGGKTCHLLERQPKLELVALEKEADRAKKIQQNLERLSLQCRLNVADARDVESWWDKHNFDVILVDAPCSGSGVIRKHPDIKHLRRQRDIAQNVELQQQILNALWPLLNSGGHLLYCTCSIFRQENDLLAQWFLENHRQAQVKELDARFGQEMSYGRQRLTAEHGGDGFYYVCFHKN